jgi:hypothetical protein
MHGGVIVQGSGNVIIGGAATGATLGNPVAGRQAFQAAAAGRSSGSSQQSYQNCGVESSRQIVNQATESNVSEDDLLDAAMDNGWADMAWTREDSGGTTAQGMQSILGSQGVSSTLQPQTMENIQQAVAEGRGVITAHDAGRLWQVKEFEGSGHAVLVTAVEFDESGKLKSVCINDTGTGESVKPVPAAQFEGSTLSGWPSIVTNNPIW